MDLRRDVGQRGQRLAVRDEQRGVAELQVHVDQRHALGAAGAQGIGQVGGQESRAAAALARDEGQRQHLAHAGAHRAQQEVLRLVFGQHDEGHAREQVAQALQLVELAFVGARRIDDQEVGHGLVGHGRQARGGAGDHVDYVAARPGAQLARQLDQVALVARKDCDLHGGSLVSYLPNALASPCEVGVT